MSSYRDSLTSHCRILQPPKKANTIVLPLQHSGVPVKAFRAIDSRESIKESRKWSHEACILPSGQASHHTSRGSPAGASQIKACLWWVRSSSQGKLARTGVGRVCSRRVVGELYKHLCSLCVTDQPLAGTRPFHGPELVAFPRLLAMAFGKDCRRYRRGL